MNPFLLPMIRVPMKVVIFAAALMLTACSQTPVMIDDRSAEPCVDSPNCVSTQDTREDHQLDPFLLTPSATLNNIEQVALSLPRANTAVKTEDYLRIEYTSRVFGFVDDLELRMANSKLWVRSQSRVGYYDFGVNRQRAQTLRAALKQASLIE